ncbi:MAG TPA: hypothetical protein VLX68_05775 [Chitinivibrionales bacterium]|nr:hypothetical protein [Chitinivibrionales bacterium]
MQYKAHKGRIPAIRLMAVILCCAFAAQGASAVLSGLELVGGSKGLALTLKADAPFTMTTEQKVSTKTAGLSLLTIHCSGVIYDLDDFEFTSFPAACPLKRLSVSERAADNSIDLLFTFTKGIDRSVAAKQKGSKWLVLLSRAPEEEFTWSPPPRMKSVPAVQKQTSVLDQSGASHLKDITLLRRDRVELLTFAFDGPTTMRLKRGQDKIMILFVNATSGLSATRFSPPGDPHTVIELKQVMHGGTMWLGAAVTLGKNALESALMQAFSDKLVIYSPSDTLQGLAFWSAASGSAMAYAFVSMPRFAVDYDGMKKKALTDMSSDAVMGKTFTVREGTPKKEVQLPAAATEAPKKEAQSPAVATAAPKKEIQSPAVAPAVPVKEVPVPSGPAPLPSVKVGAAPLRLLMKKNDVVVRAEPVASGKVMAKLPLGTVATQAEKKGAWVKIITPEVAGWVSAAMTVDSTKAPRAVLKAVEKFNLKRLAQQKAAEAKAARESAAKEKAEQTKLEKEKLAKEREAQKKAGPEVKVPAMDSSLHIAVASMQDTAQAGKNISAKKQVEYHIYGRDPFLPLSGNEEQVPTVEKLKLVGILYDEADRIALFEDADGKARALKENDPVQNGYVLRVQPDKVLFLLNDLGISRTYAMKLNKENEK